MKAEHINPILESVDSMCRTMLEMPVTRGGITAPTPTGCPRQITALIGISGSLCGVIALAFPEATALAIAGKLLHTEIDAVDETVSDAIAELTNIVAGAAKAKLGANREQPNQLGLPSVVRGSNYHVDYPSDATWVEIPFLCPLGPFTLRLTLQEYAVPTPKPPSPQESMP